MKNGILLFIAGFYSILSSAQHWSWENTSGPPGKFFWCVSKKGNEILASDWGDQYRVFRSENSGQSWIQCTNPPWGAMTVHRCGNNILAGDFLSDDSGYTWQTVLHTQYGISRIIEMNGDCYALSKWEKKIYRSHDCGYTWEDVSFNIHIPYWSMDDIFISDSTIYVAEWADGVFCRRLSDTVWETRNNGLQLGVDCLYGKNNELWAGTTDSGIFYSNNGGVNWQRDNVGYPLGIRAQCFAANDSFVFCGTASGLYKCRFNSHHWVLVQGLKRFISITNLNVSNDSIFVATGEDGLLSSSDGGISWRTHYEISRGAKIVALATNGNYIFAARKEYDRFYRSSDGGTNWEAIANKEFTTLYNDDGKILAGDAVHGGMYSSSDNGNSWNYSAIPGQGTAKKIMRFNSCLFVLKNELYVSCDNEGNWSRELVGNHANVLDIEQFNNDMYAISNYSLYRSSDGLNWTSVIGNLPNGVSCVGLEAGTSRLYLNAYDKVFWTSDGNTWQELVNNGLPTLCDHRYIFIVDDNVFSVPHTYGLYGSDEYYGLFLFRGGQWCHITDTVPYGPSAVMKYQNYIWAGVGYGVVKIAENVMTDIAGEVVKANAEVKIYPNPSADDFTFDFSSNQKGNLQLKLTNTLGQTVFTECCNSFTGSYHRTLNLSDRPKGIYFVEIICGEQHCTKKIVLQ